MLLVKVSNPKNLSVVENKCIDPKLSLKLTRVGGKHTYGSYSSIASRSQNQCKCEVSKQYTEQH